MTPFERAEKNIRDLAIKLNLYALLHQTIEDTRGLEEEEAEAIWKVILLMIEASDLTGEEN